MWRGGVGVVKYKDCFPWKDKCQCKQLKIMGAEKKERFSVKTKCNVLSIAVFAIRPWYQCSRQLLGFSGSQRAPRTSRAHSPAAARRNPGPGCRVPSVGPRPATTGAPERRKMRGYTFCRGGVYADQLTSSRSASDDAFSVATNHRQINRYIVDSILQYI